MVIEIWSTPSGLMNSASARPSVSRVTPNMFCFYFLICLIINFLVNRFFFGAQIHHLPEYANTKHYD